MRVGVVFDSSALLAHLRLGLPLMGADVLEVGRLTNVVGSQGTAHAVLEAHKNGTSLATCKPDVLQAVMRPDDVDWRVQRNARQIVLEGNVTQARS